MILAGTGHRPPKLGLDYTRRSNELLRRFLVSQLEEQQGVEAVINGCAQGFDQALAEAALDLGMPLICAVPFEGMDSKWPSDGKKRLQRILERAVRVHVVSPGGYANWKFAERDRWMVDNSQLLMALFDEQEKASGTGITVRYGRELKRPIINTWDRWTVYLSKERVQPCLNTKSGQ